MEDNIITLALSSRLKRRIFANSGIQTETEKLVRKNIVELNTEVLDISFKDYGMILTLKNTDRLSSEDIAYFIRTRTSAPIREKFPELSKMPSLWSRKIFCEDGRITDGMSEKINKYYDSLKSR